MTLGFGEQSSLRDVCCRYLLAAYVLSSHSLFLVKRLFLPATLYFFLLDCRKIHFAQLPVCECSSTCTHPSVLVCSVLQCSNNARDRLTCKEQKSPSHVWRLSSLTISRLACVLSGRQQRCVLTGRSQALQWAPAPFTREKPSNPRGHVTS